MQLNKIHRLSISITGILLVWKSEYLWLSISEARELKNFEVSAIADAVARIESLHPPGSVLLVQLFSEDLSIHKVFLQDKQYAWHKQNGELIQQWSSNERLEDWLLDLHHRFLLGNTIGLNIAGFGGLLMLPLMIVGLVLWWPRRRLFKLGIRPKDYRRGNLMRSHFNLGVLSFLPILVITITGVILVYPTEARTLLLSKQTQQDAMLKNQPSTIQADATVDTWQARISYTLAEYPESRIRWASPATEKYPEYRVGVQQKHAWNRMGNTSLVFRGGVLVENKNAFHNNVAQRLMQFTYPLHVGKLDLWYRIILTAFGLSLAMLCLLGLGSFVKRGKE